MSLKQRLADDLKAAMKAGDRPRVDCLRMLRARILDHEVSLRPQRGPEHELGDGEATQVVAAYAKQRREAIAEFRNGRREDLASREEAELAIVQSYLPEPLDEAAIRALVRTAIADVAATSVRDLGAVMKRVLPAVQGRADGALVSRIVREALE
jgi:uncharacterized protein YqeY